MRVLPASVWNVLVILCVHEGAVCGQPPAGKDREIAALVERLGAYRFADREEASAKLEEIGEPALRRLRRAVVGHESLEVRKRAQRGVARIMKAACRSRSLGLELVIVNPGEFEMGSPETEVGHRGDETLRRVRLSQQFLMGKFEVTQAEYLRVMETNPSWFKPGGGGQAKVVDAQTEQLPVEGVSWFDALEFCNRLSEQDGHLPCYRLEDVQRDGQSIKSAKVTFLDANGFRLPTEAEWEYACRAGSKTAYHSSNAPGAKHGNFKSVTVVGYGTEKAVDVGRTTRVGTYLPNKWGLYDMHGNVGEWCQDWYAQTYDAAASLDPSGPAEGKHRVLRGGSWLVNYVSARSASRYWGPAGEDTFTTGLRVMRIP